MTLQVNPNQVSVFTALRSFLLGLPLLYDSTQQSVVSIIQGQVNRAPEPTGPDFVTMTPLRAVRLETNIDTFAGGTALGPNTYLTFMQPTHYTIQLDVHGPFSMDNSAIISTMFRDQYAMDAFAAAGQGDIVPLYADDPRQSPFMNAEDQYENRWIVEANIQVNQLISSVPQQSADVLEINLIEVETLPPLLSGEDLVTETNVDIFTEPGLEDITTG